MRGRALEGLRELVDLVVEHVVPLVVVLHPTPPRGTSEQGVADTAHKPRAEAHDEQARKLKGVPRKHEQVDEDDVAVALEEELELGEQHHGRKDHHAHLKHDETGELHRRRLTHRKASLGELVDLRWQGPHLHGREVAKEDSRRLHGHEVTHANGATGVEHGGDDVGSHAKDEVERGAHERAKEPPRVDVLEGRDKLLDLAREEQERNVGGEHERDELSAAGSLLLVGVGDLLGSGSFGTGRCRRAVKAGLRCTGTMDGRSRSHRGRRHRRSALVLRCRRMAV